MHPTHSKKNILKFEQLTPGTTVRVHQLIHEGEKDRTQIYEGMIIGRSGKKIPEATIKVRRIAIGGVGVERIFPIFSPLLEKIEIVKRAKRIRRAKLNYLKKKVGVAMKMHENQVGNDIMMNEEEVQIPQTPEVATAPEVVQDTSKKEVKTDVKESKE